MNLSPVVPARPPLWVRFCPVGSVLPVVAACALALAALSPRAEARPVPHNLGGGLDRLAAGGATPVGAAASRSLAPGQSSADAEVDAGAPGLAQQDLMLRDELGRVLVKISLDGDRSLRDLSADLVARAGARISATDAGYRAGVIEAWVPVSELVNLATTRGVLAVVPSSPFVLDVGAATTQGVALHRVDRLAAGENGAGITVGVLSDSYNTSTSPITAGHDIASGDLPGEGNPLGNTAPVVVLQDQAGGTDEGRAMLQIVHDMAPGARLGFATAFGGEVNFANNIRSLAGLEDAPNAVDGFKADVIVDDIIYLAEPMFQDGVIAQAVDDVARAGVSYFASAGNRPGTQAYDARVRIVPAEPASLAGTNLNFSNVDPALYAGGFHNFGDDDAIDIAQTVNINRSGTLVFQWNEPFDPVPPTVIENLTFGFGTTTVDEPEALFTFEGEAGTTVRIYVDGDGFFGNENPDVTIALFGPDFGFIAFRDATTNPETLFAELEMTGTYYVLVGGYEGAVGDFYYQVDEVEIVEQVLTDFNVLWFTGSGAFIGALAEENRITNRPIELGGLSLNGAANFQIVIARANVPETECRRRRPADRLRCVWFNNGVPQEHFSYLTSATYGHNCARGANSVAAYAFYPPFVPEPFTSPGTATIYFDEDNRRLRHPDLRKKPDIAAMDGANNTFFGGGDALQDPDTLPNFFGTSAAAPHAAGIAALMLQAAGGPCSLRPDKLADLLKESAFPHDLDPHFAFGLARTRRAGLVGVSAAADGNAISQFDPNVFAVANLGLSGIARLSLNLAGGNTTGTPTGMVFDERPGAGQAFILGGLDGVAPADVAAVLELPADPPGVAGQWKQLSLTFAAGSFKWGDSIGFGIDRDEADAFGPSGAVAGNSADLLGAGVLLPQGTIAPGGATFSGTLENGESFSGRFYNLIGCGYSRLDGYGFVNAEEAVRLAARRGRGKR